MKNSLKIILIVLPLFFLLCSQAITAEPNIPAQDLSTLETKTTPWIITCKGMIDNGLYKSIDRRTQHALDNGAEYIIYEVGTYGGLVEAADNISKYLILEVSKKAHTVAYVTTEAISAGAMVSVSCQDIIMLENTTIGCSAPIAIGQKLEGVEREKTESFIRATFERAAEANNYPAPILMAMVSVHKEIYRIKNLQTGKDEFFESEKLPKDADSYDLEGKELIINDKELLTITASKALDYGVARAQVKDLAEALDFLAKRDNVTFGQPVVLETNWSEEMVRWLNHPAVMGVLVMLAMLGVYIELNSPGVGLPGLLAVICLTIIIGSKYLTGLANWLEVGLFIIGVVLLLIEILVIPGFGITGFLGITCILAGLFGMLIKNPPDQIPWPETSFDWKVFIDGLTGFSLGIIGFLVLAWLLAKHLPKMKFLSGLTIAPAPRPKLMPVSMTTTPQAENIPVSIGDIGCVITMLHPVGQAKFGEAIVDVVAEAEFLDQATKVKIIEIHGNRVVVQQIKE